jgi:hypothetical protein
MMGIAPPQRPIKTLSIRVPTYRGGPRIVVEAPVRSGQRFRSWNPPAQAHVQTYGPAVWATLMP